MSVLGPHGSRSWWQEMPQTKNRCFDSNLIPDILWDRFRHVVHNDNHNAGHLAPIKGDSNPEPYEGHQLARPQCHMDHEYGNIPSLDSYRTWLVRDGSCIGAEYLELKRSIKEQINITACAIKEVCINFISCQRFLNVNDKAILIVTFKKYIYDN